MRYLKAAVISLAAAAILASTSYVRAEEIVLPVSIVHSPDGRPCTFVQLQGRTDWFAIPTDQIGYKETIAFLTVSFVSGSTLWISTDTVNTACGYPRLSATRLYR